MNHTPTKRKRSNSIWKPILLIWAILFIAGCEEDDPLEDPFAIRSKYIGTWQVTENTGINHPQFYTVSIVAGSEVDEIVIEGLYNEPRTRVAALISTTSLSIPNQSTEGINFIGNGSANADYSQIQLTFTADDGSGPDVVEAVLVP